MNNEKQKKMSKQENQLTEISDGWYTCDITIAVATGFTLVRNISVVCNATGCLKNLSVLKLDCNHLLCLPDSIGK